MNAVSEPKNNSTSDAKTRQQAQFDKMTKTPVMKLVISLSIPTVLCMLITNIYNIADTIFVGAFGTSASGAVGVVFGFMAILQACGFFFGQGCGSILSRQLGAKDTLGASETASTGFFCSLLVSVVIAIISWFNLDSIVYMLGSTQTIAPFAKRYIAYILISAPFLVSSFTLNNILRYEGKATLGTIGMMTGAILNIIGDPIFMFGLNMGIDGAGLSTAISQIISFCILLYMFITGKTQTRLSIRLFTQKAAVLGNIAATGLPSLLRQSLGSISTIILNTLARPYHDPAIAAMGIVSKISFFVFSVALGIGQGFQPISGFNYGAKKYKRVRDAFKCAFILAEIAMVLITIPVLMYPAQIIRHFRDDAQVIYIGTRALRLQILAQVFLPFCMMLEMLFQTTNKKVTASLLSATRSGLLFIPLLFILARFRGLNGIQEAQPLAMVLSCIPCLILQFIFFRKMPKNDE